MAVEPAIARDTAERAGVRSTALAFQLGDDLHHAHLRTAGNRAARKNRAQGLARADIIAQATAHIRDDVVHMRIAFERHQLVDRDRSRSEEHTSELQSLMRISYAVFCLKKKKNNT